MVKFEDTALVDDAGVDEVGELILTLLSTPAHRLTACRGWTAHELVAHLAAGAAEEAGLIEAYLAGEQRPTRAHDERERPYRSLPDVELRDRLVEEAARLTLALDELSHRDDERVIFTGRPMSVADFAMHSRSECALHRWDLVGRDDVGWAMLSQPALTKHAMSVLTSMSTLPEAPANRAAAALDHTEIRAVIRSAPHDDVVLSVDGGAVGMSTQPIDETEPDIELDAAARLLLLWGRREPSAPIDLHAGGDSAMLLGSLFGW
jgi:uncharacterized protein (TIGR03083 family)